MPGTLIFSENTVHQSQQGVQDPPVTRPQLTFPSSPSSPTSSVHELPSFAPCPPSSHAPQSLERQQGHLPTYSSPAHPFHLKPQSQLPTGELLVIMNYFFLYVPLYITYKSTISFFSFFK